VTIFLFIHQKNLEPRVFEAPSIRARAPKRRPQER
jgi:hypothetical protein